MASKKTEKLDHFPDVRKMVYECKMFKIKLLRRRNEGECWSKMMKNWAIFKAPKNDLLR